MYGLPQWKRILTQSLATYQHNPWAATFMKLWSKCWQIMPKKFKPLWNYGDETKMTKCVQQLGNGRWLHLYCCCLWQVPHTIPGTKFTFENSSENRTTSAIFVESPLKDRQTRWAVEQGWKSWRANNVLWWGCFGVGVGDCTEVLLITTTPLAQICPWDPSPISQ